jgi:hypothetical protein
MKFQELKFNPHPSGMGGVQAIMTFKNGFEVSVIQFQYSYGGDKGLYELAVRKNGTLHYDNPVADGDVRGYLTEEEVEKLATQVEGFEKEAPNDGTASI